MAETVMRTSASVGVDRDEDRDESIGGLVQVRVEMIGEAKKLSAVSNVRFVWAVVRQWSVIAAAMGVAVWSESWVVYVLMMLVIGTRQHALGILIHDGTHYRCLSNRKLNDIACDLFCALPVGMLTSRYRYEHQMHHRFINTEQDPYWVDFSRDAMWHWPKDKRRAMYVFVGDLFGFNAASIGRAVYRWSPWINHFAREGYPRPPTRSERMTIYGFLLFVVGLLVLTGGWLTFTLLWLVPLSTITVLLIRLRTIAEHLALPNRKELDASRHVDGTLLEQLSVAPLNINYHIDHHLFPSVPYYNLPKLHELLLKNERYRVGAHINRSYFGGKYSVLAEIVK